MADMASIVTVVDACGRAGVPVLLRGGPGQGKSSLVRGLAASAGLRCETVLGSIREPAEIAGMPVTTADGVRLEPPAWAKRLAAEGEGVLFLDELTTCAPSVQAAMLAVVLDRAVGDLVLPATVRMIAAANPPEQAAGGYDLEPPLSNRFCHVGFTPSVDEWLDGMATGWEAVPASRAGVNSAERLAASTAAVTGFIRLRPELLDKYPDSSAATGGPWPSRRTWAMTAKVLSHLRADDVAATQAAVFGLVGEGAGAEFLSWVATADLPDPDAVIADPARVDWAGERPDRIWAVLAGVTTLAAQRGGVEAWRKAWGPLVACAKAGAPDVAASSARALGKSRPAKATIPASAREAFLPLLKAAGLIDDAEAVA
ncbi:AAA family ATPase [Mycobacterium timonense]|uniref:AAA family ATPase n=2 Tax=Mycobacterium TaxID=1763 RepID=A0AAW5S8B4_MYCBC|nr:MULTISPECIES: AAA family ATPase [Mycobacterium]KMV14816.1 ATPase AAA [Mycobacterium heckeshornense]MCV6991784.1 AAA family ATPase [Mycobacterium bouchedurhonense]MCV6996708.1 AAA family ATPase [Mycobacterium timonense]ORA40589.1 AAA family ATPase [Mycobacterium bouchedurhonense]ORW07709.1 AAA family ATPase [Mycobacterium kyorinense]